MNGLCQITSNTGYSWHRTGELPLQNFSHDGFQQSFGMWVSAQVLILRLFSWLLNESFSVCVCLFDVEVCGSALSTLQPQKYCQYHIGALFVVTAGFFFLAFFLFHEICSFWLLLLIKLLYKHNSYVYDFYIIIIFLPRSFKLSLADLEFTLMRKYK